MQKCSCLLILECLSLPNTSSLNVVVFSLLHAVSGVVKSPEPQSCILCSHRHFQCSSEMPLTFSSRSSWPDQQGDPNLPRARRTLMKTTEADACPAAVPLTPNTLMWICKTFSTCLFKARQFGFCSNSHQLAVQLFGSLWMALFAFYVLGPK